MHCLDAHRSRTSGAAKSATKLIRGLIRPCRSLTSLGSRSDKLNLEELNCKAVRWSPRLFFFVFFYSVSDVRIAQGWFKNSWTNSAQWPAFVPFRKLKHLLLRSKTQCKKWEMSEERERRLSCASKLQIGLSHTSDSDVKAHNGDSARSQSASCAHFKTTSQRFNVGLQRHVLGHSHYRS